MPSRPDATQREGSALERLLQDLGRTLDEARAAAEQGSAAPPSAEAPGIPGRPSVPGKPGRAKTTLATRPGVDSPTTRSEAPTVRGERVEVDQDDEAERIVQQRLNQVAARGGALGEADHRRFDQRIRQPPAEQSAKQPKETSMERLRQAVIWREILGPPVSLRDERDG